MDVFECQNCGAKLSNSDRACKYCGSKNEHFVDIKKTYSDKYSFKSINNNTDDEAKNKKIFIICLIAFAIIFLRVVSFIGDVTHNIFFNFLGIIIVVVVAIYIIRRSKK